MLDYLRPVSPLFPYIGGKRNLAPAIVEMIGAIPHHLYAEPFVGAGGVFLRRPMATPVEVINDRSRDIATFFRVLQRHYQALLDMLKWQLSTRADFERLMATDPETLTDLERSARFLYLQRLAFGGKVRGRTFGVSRTAPARFDLGRLVPMLEDVHERLARVVIECLDFGEFIARYDGAETLFYLDPPYFGSEADYGRDVFGPGDFGRLAQQLRAIRGRFLLSINDLPETREIFTGFELRELSTTYTIREGDGLPTRELLVCGPRPLANLRRPIQVGSLL